MTKSKHVPKRRFPGFEGEWEQKQLDELSTHRSGTAIENYFSKNGLYKVISIGSYGLDGNYIDQGIRAISNEITDNQVVKKNELTMVLNDKTSNGTIIGRTLLIDSSDEFVVNQRTEIITPKNVFNPLFAFALLNGKFRDKVKKIVQGGTQIYVNYSSVKKLQLHIPNLIEQKQLGILFQTIDRLINLHQQKLDKLKNLKKSYLAEFFPAEGERVPKRRFPGFEGEWEEKKLKDVSEIYDGTHQTPRYTTDGIMFLSVENIKTLKSNKYISKDDFIKDFKIFPQNGDVLMTRIGDIGTSNVVNTDDKLAFYVSLALIRSAQLDSNFLNTSISSVNFQKELWSRTLHIAFPKKINKNEIGEVSILFPSISEQKQIGSFFQNLDKSVTLQQQKLDKLKDLKKAYLNELFV